MLSSRYSLLLALVPALAVAQDRGPTSPLDQPEQAPAVAIEPLRPPGPAAAEAPGSAPALSAPLAVTAVVPMDAPVLLPPGTLDGDGLTPTEAAQRAGAQALAVQRAGAGRSAAEAGVRFARLGFVPKVSASARYTRLSDIQPGTLPSFDTAACLQDVTTCQQNPGSFTRTVVLQEPILNQYALHAQVGSTLTDLIGYQRLQLEAAEADLRAAGQSVEVARDEAALAGLSAYFELVRARAQRVLARDAASVAERRQAEAEARRAGGLATEGDLLAVRAQVAGVTRLVALAEGREAVAEATLRDLLALPDGEPVRLGGPFAGAPPAPESLEALLASRPVAERADVAAAQARAEATEARAAADRTRLYPALSVSFNVDDSQPNQRIFPQKEEFVATWDASVVLSWSLDGALLSSARADQQSASAREQRLAAQDISQALERAVRQARVGLLAALSGVDAQRLAAASAADRLRRVSERRTAGVATETERLDAENTALSARLGLVDALVDAWLAHARLRRALGEQPADASLEGQ